VLAVIDNLPGDRALKDAVKGEAYLTRAYGHFMLVNLFAKDYNPQTASQDPGIPYVLEPETEFVKQYNRNTIEEVYDLIEEDIEQGLDLVDSRFYANSGKYHFTEEAALAFASRFYLFKEDWAKCIEYSSQLLGASPISYIKDIPNIIETKANTDDFVRLMTSPNDRSNLLLIRNVTNAVVSVGYWPDEDLLDILFENNPWGAEDIRTSNEYPIYVFGSNGLGLAKFEFLFERSSLTSNVGFNYTIISAFRGDEVVLNRAESYIHMNQLDLALADLQLYVSKRYDNNPPVSLQPLRSYYGTTNDQVAMLLYVLDERQKEFIHEGLRWFDIKRYSIPVEHLWQDGSILTLEADDLRKVLQIPQTAIDVGGLEPNPR
jgi:hypothetical protein